MTLSSKKSLDRALCRHAFDDTVVSTARLAAYSTSRSLKAIGHGEYYNISEDICKKDLLILSISVRKLAEITETTSKLKEKSIQCMKPEQEKNNISSISVWDLIGNIIHGVEIDVVKNIGMALYAHSDPLKASRSKEEIDAAVIIKSDKFPRRAFKLNDFISHINTYTDEANDKMSEHGIYLGSGFE
ncbi:hypothetical protein RvVAT039_02620 [Agrobacterium vitis]|uniref:hypothetical protein n=1 Tax=Agrobacterium vitis TaxID=373 RepID=UPI0015D754A1|nr:hypothetical protein [Agrobacterium vitis]BCH59153.1 hypothetical protein RvVAR0630_17770 [Agrobacterium vitis]BCH63046.1 hypothetical protein RvVAT039_02620 [Agrobacterium vitis]